MRSVDWNGIRCFVAVAEAGSLTRAATKLSLSVGAVSRRIDQLESALGLKLMRRGPQGVKLTEAGTQLLSIGSEGAARFDAIERAARALRNPERKRAIKISATEPFVAQVLAPNLCDLMRAHPDLRTVLSVSNDNVSLQAGDADIAIRMAKPESETIVGRRLPPIALGLYCSEAYLGGRNPTAVTLSEETLLWFDRAFGDIPENRWLSDRGLDNITALRTGSSEALRQAAISGAGIAPVPSRLAAGSGLIEIASDPLPERNPWLLFHRDQRRQRDHKAVRDWIVASCKRVFQ